MMVIIVLRTADGFLKKHNAVIKEQTCSLNITVKSTHLQNGVKSQD